MSSPSPGESERAVQCLARQPRAALVGAFLYRLIGILFGRALRGASARALDRATHKLALPAELGQRPANDNWPVAAFASVRAPLGAAPLPRPGLPRLGRLHGFTALRRDPYRAGRIQRELEIELRGEALLVRRRTLFLGRTLRASEARYALGRVTGAQRRACFARVRRFAGSGLLVFGTLLGGYFVFDGSRGGAPLVLLLGVVLLGLGSVGDLALNVYWPARAARVDVHVALRGARPVRIRRIDHAAADRLVGALSAHWSRGH